MEPHECVFVPPQEAGATPVQEIAYAMATAIDVLDAVKASGRITDDEFTGAFDDLFARTPESNSLKRSASCEHDRHVG